METFGASFVMEYVYEYVSGGRGIGDKSFNLFKFLAMSRPCKDIYKSFIFVHISIMDYEICNSLLYRHVLYFSES